MILARLQRMLADCDSPLDEITQLLKCDAALATRLLRVANSAVYHLDEKCDSLEEAVLRVGFTEVYRMAGFVAATQIAERRLAFYGVAPAAFRENALLTALVMEQLATLVDVDPAAAYTVGLLRSVGKIALDHWMSSPGHKRDWRAYREGPLAEWEKANVGLHNGEAAEIVMSEWLFPASTIEAIRHHYAPADASLLAKLLNLAAGAAERGGHGWPGERFYWSDSPEALGVDRLALEHIDDAMRVALESFGPVRAAVG
jgi:HD-like signal output (HDOD) protein